MIIYNHSMILKCSNYYIILHLEKHVPLLFDANRRRPAMIINLVSKSCEFIMMANRASLDLIVNICINAERVHFDANCSRSYTFVTKSLLRVRYYKC